MLPAISPENSSTENFPCFLEQSDQNIFSVENLNSLDELLGGDSNVISLASVRRNIALFFTSTLTLLSQNSQNFYSISFDNRIRRRVSEGWVLDFMIQGDQTQGLSSTYVNSEVSLLATVERYEFLDQSMRSNSLFSLDSENNMQDSEPMDVMMNNPFFLGIHLVQNFDFEKLIPDLILGEWNISSKEISQSGSLLEQEKKGFRVKASKYKKECSIAIKDLLRRTYPLKVIKPLDHAKKNLSVMASLKKKISPLANSFRKPDENQQEMQHDKLKKYLKFRKKKESKFNMISTSSKKRYQSLLLKRKINLEQGSLLDGAKQPPPIGF